MGVSELLSPLNNFPSFFQRDLTKRRENKARAELAGKTDKVNTLRQEIAENENQLNMAQVVNHLVVFHQTNFLAKV